MCLHQVRAINHFSIQTKRSRARVFIKQRYDAFGTLQFSGRRNKCPINDFDLSRVYREHAGEAIASRIRSIICQTFSVSIIRKDRIHRCNFRRCGGEQTQ